MKFGFHSIHTLAQFLARFEVWYVLGGYLDNFTRFWIAPIAG